MKSPTPSSCFQSELRSWAWRGGLCALPSAGWAWAMDYRHPYEIFAMLSVVGAFIVFFAVGSTGMAMSVSPKWQRFSRAVKTAAAIKIGTLPGAVAYWIMVKGWLPKALAWLVLLVWPDLLLGLCSVESVSAAVGSRESLQLAKGDSFGLTGLTALVQGTLFTVLLVLIALAVVGTTSLHAKCRSAAQKKDEAQGAGSAVQ